MPIRLSTSDPDRMIIGVASGVVTLNDLIDFARSIVSAGKLHYRKIVDVSAGTLGFTPEELVAFGELVRAARGDKPRGALAIVTGARRGDLARLFAEQLAGGDRPAQVFASIHEARRWLATNPHGV